MRLALVTGAGKGLGYHLCSRLLQAGYRVVGQYRHSKAALELLASQHDNFYPIYGDFSTPQQVEAFCKKVRDFLHQHSLSLEVLIHNVGNFLSSGASNCPLDELYTLYQTNVFAAIAITQAFLGSIEKSEGDILLIGYAGLESRTSDTFAFPYFLTKQSLLTFTKTLAKELIAKKVRVNMLSPGHLENTIVEVKDPSALLYSRLSTLDEFSSALLFFLSDESKYITGQNLEVSGGVLL